MISLNPATLLNGNGIDVNSLVNQVLSQESGPEQVWQQQQTTLAIQAGLLAGINNNLTNLANAVNSLADVLGPLAAMSATSSDSGILTATAQSSAAAGTHQIVVGSLATTGTVYTDPVADANTSILPTGANSGDISLQVGGAGGQTRDIVITAGNNDTLTTLASYINGQNWGVTANVVTDTSGARLAIYSQASGSPGALAINSNTSSLNFNQPLGGTDASLTIDGVPVHSASNTVTGAIAGVTLNLAGADPDTTAQLTVGTDTSQAVQAINSFVNAYNILIGNINQQFTVDPTSNSEGPLGSDSSLRSLQSSLLSDVTYSVAGNSGLVNLAALGINMNDDGTLTVGTTPDGKSMSDVLAANPTAFRNFFQNDSLTGFANNLKTDLTGLTDATAGVLTSDIAQNKAQQEDLATSINYFQTRLLAQQQALLLQFSQVNATLESYPYLLQAVTSQLSALPNLLGTTSTTTPGG